MAVTYLVTGGTGFLGRYLVRRLVDRPGTHVRVLARREDEELAHLGVRFVRGSVLDPDVTRAAMDGCAGVFHLAGKVLRDPKRAHELYELHVTGTRTVLEAAADLNVRRTVVASTSGTVAITRDGRTVPDDTASHVTEIAKDWPYYLSKIYAESTAQRIARKRQLDVVWLRPSLLLGPDDRDLSSCGDVIHYLRGAIPVVPSGGLSFVDVRDTADAFVAAMERGRPGATYLLGGCNLTFQAFFERLERISGVRAPRLHLPDGAARWGAKALELGLRAMGKEPDVDAVSVAMAQHFWYVDWSAAVRDLGFRPRDPDATLRDTVAWLRTLEAMHGDLPERPQPAHPTIRPAPPKSRTQQEREDELRRRFEQALDVIKSPMRAVAVPSQMAVASSMAVARSVAMASTVHMAPVLATPPNPQPAIEAPEPDHPALHPASDVYSSLPAWGPHGGRSRIVYETLGDGPDLENVIGGAVDAFTSAVGGKGVATTTDSLKRSARGLRKQFESGRFPGVPGWFKPKK